jgi:hypothetical protein
MEREMFNGFFVNLFKSLTEKWKTTGTRNHEYLHYSIILDYDKKSLILLNVTQ